MILSHPRGWRLDASALGLDARVDALDWPAVFAAMEELEGGAVANADEQRQVGHYWLRAPELAPTMGQARGVGEAVEAVEEFADRIRSGSIVALDGLPFTDVLHIGIGGSALAPQLLTHALGDAHLGVHFVDNVDPEGVVRALLDIGPRLRHTLVIVASKSGNTVEPMASLKAFEEALAADGLDLPSRAVALTSPGSRLDKRARKEGWCAVFPVWEWVGGRFGATSVVGLLPAALTGVAPRAFLQGAREMDAWTRAADWRTNPAAVLAAAWFVLGDGEGRRDLCVLPYRDRLSMLSRFLQQLVMESVGKAKDRAGERVEHGLTVYGYKGSTDQHAYVQQLRDGRNDAITHFIQVLGEPRGSMAMGDLLQDFMIGTRRALLENGRPALTITLETLDGPSLAGLVALFERAVGLYAELVNLNAYHQPGVEAGKKAALGASALRERLVAALVDRERRLEDLAEVCGAEVSDARDLLDRLVATRRAVKTAKGYRSHRPLDG
ncbi:MAG: glucose-6-phosphate isomerase [Proteobacteria bacterium]|nr:glucose-6-phosphate isomerase [Pseudomonadota bacterium]